MPKVIQRALIIGALVCLSLNGYADTEVDAYTGKPVDPPRQQRPCTDQNTMHARATTGRTLAMSGGSRCAVGHRLAH